MDHDTELAQLVVDWAESEENVGRNVWLLDFVQLAQDILEADDGTA